MKFLKSKILAMASLSMAGLCLSAQSEGQIMKTITGTINPTQKIHKISDTMYGVFFEDINFAADGGLYAELIRNRSFEFPNPFHGWEPDGDFELRKGDSNDVVPFPRNPHYVRLNGAKHREQWTALDNTGFRGLPFKKDEQYRVSFWARTANNTKSARLKAMFVPEDGYASFGEVSININSSEWKEYKVILKPTITSERGKFRILFDGHSGTVDIDHISVFPVDTFNAHENGLRKDLAQTIADLKPGIFRFPGGCIIEGTTLEQRYNWKDSIGPVGNRPLNGNRWNNTFVKNLTPDYFQTYGLGFYEFFLFCEEIGAEPLPVVNCGIACQFQNSDNDPTAHVALDKLEPYIQDALDLIEFANGPADSKWGKIRAEMGHEKPFNMKYLGIGNEQWGKLYTDRLPLFLEKIRAKYPNIHIVGSSGPNPDGADFNYLWPKMKEFKVDLVDEHYYRNAEWFLNQIHRYDKYDRNGPKVFAGEYACHENPNNSLYAGLCEAAFMTGLERNADVVKMSSYAPLLSNFHAWQWRHDLIWFNNFNVVKTPSYYVQYLYSNNKGTDTLNIADLSDCPNKFYISSVVDTLTNDVIVKIINLDKNPQNIKIKITGAKNDAAVSAFTLTGKLHENNDEMNPNRILLQSGNLKLKDGYLDSIVSNDCFMVFRITFE